MKKHVLRELREADVDRCRGNPFVQPARLSERVLELARRRVAADSLLEVLQRPEAARLMALELFRKLAGDRFEEVHPLQVTVDGRRPRDGHCAPGQVKPIGHDAMERSGDDGLSSWAEEDQAVEVKGRFAIRMRPSSPCSARPSMRGTS
ncbi:MAG: hypothetical protein E6G22_01625 [Actinobacteria bacterium]|nr:MAG: hypothetical protein E6G22_01625 [Actinomycetota bacterium]